MLAAPSAHAAFPGANGKIAFSSTTDLCLHSIEPDGTGLQSATPCQPVSGNAPDEHRAAWASDSRRLAYYDQASGVNFFVTDGANRTALWAGSGDQAGLSWSPSGERLVVADQSFDSEPFTWTSDIVTIDGSGDGTPEAMVLLEAQSGAPYPVLAAPAWSPDGQRIAFARWNESTRLYQIYVMNADGTGVTRLTNNSSDDSEPDWSPDGSKIVFGRDGAIWVMNANGAGQAQLTNGASRDNGPAWSPDGAKITFQRAPVTCPCSPEILTMNSDGTSPTNLTNTPSISETAPAWQPIITSYARPKGASPSQIYLVPAYKPCIAPANRTHGSPLAFPSCAPPSQASGTLTVGTPDAPQNGQAAKSVAKVFYAAHSGDLAITATISDVRNKSDLSDYTGELSLASQVRITDKNNGPGPGTVVDTTLPVTIPCAGTADTSVGSDCNLTASVNSVYPGAITSGQRSIWALGQVKAYDGGPDGDVDTTGDNTLFMDEGIFVP
jgi:dipeptidyl aminopeptidase/acylaminoacyl peptidase